MAFPIRICVLLCIAWAGPSAAQAPGCPAPPAGWTVDLRKGADFHVCYYYHRASKATLGVYRGFAPRFRPPEDGLGIAGGLAGEQTVWFRNVAEGPALHYEALVKLDDDRCGGYRAHAWVMASNPEELERALQLAADLPLRPLPARREKYAMVDLRLVATGGQWAEFEDPSGKRRRFALHERLGERSAYLVEITASNATVDELFREEDCELKTRRCVFTQDSVSCPPPLKVR